MTAPGITVARLCSACGQVRPCPPGAVGESWRCAACVAPALTDSPTGAPPDWVHPSMVADDDDAEQEGPCASCGALPGTKHTAGCFYMRVQVGTEGNMDAARALYDATRAERDAARVDAARMEWLERFSTTVEAHDARTGDAWVFSTTGALRVAVDEARAETPAPRRCASTWDGRACRLYAEHGGCHSGEDGVIWWGDGAVSASLAEHVAQIEAERDAITARVAALDADLAAARQLAEDRRERLLQCAELFARSPWPGMLDQARAIRAEHGRGR